MIHDPENLTKKFHKIFDLLNEYRVFSFVPAFNAKICKRAHQIFNLPSENELIWEDFDCSQSYDFGITHDDWFAFQFDIDNDNDENSEFFNRFTFQIERNYLVRAWDDDSPSGPEGRCWINGKPLTSIDAFHDGAVLVDCPTGINHIEVIIFTAHCRSHHILKKVGVTKIHRNTEVLFRTLKVYLELIDELENDSSSSNHDLERFIRVVNMSLNQLDIRDLSFPIKLNDIRIHDRDNIVFYRSVKNCLDILFSFKTAHNTDFSVNVIGYSHLDSCWLWPFSLSKSKIINTMTNTLNLLNFPEKILKISQENNHANWKFLLTAPQHSEWIIENDENLFKEIKNQGNRIFFDGGMWIESETTISNGETLIRQIMHANQFSTNKVLFLPDCFGFSASLPQILKLSGINYFITSKISWSLYTKFPYSTFVWRGIDGSEVLTHFISCPNDKKPGATQYVGTNTVHEIIQTYNNYKQKNILPNSALCMMGRGDGGIDEEMAWNIHVLSNIPSFDGLPKVNFPNLCDIFNEIEAKKNDLNVWDDELYLERHQGTLTSGEEVKRTCKILERKLHSIEWILVIIQILCKSVDIQAINSKLEKIWRYNLLFHVHDAITGTSTNQANFELLTIGQKCIDQLNQIEQKLIVTFISHLYPSSNQAKVVFNTLSHDIDFINTTIPSGGWKIIENDEQIKYSSFETEFYQRIAKDDSFNVHKFHFNDINHNYFRNNKLIYDSQLNIISTVSLEIKLNIESGSFSYIKDRKTGRIFSSCANQFLFYNDFPIAYPSWDIQLYHKEMQLAPPKLLSFQVNETENYLQLEFQISNKSKLTQFISFHDRIMIFSTDVEWHEHDKLLKVAFPTNIRSRSAKYGIQFGYIDRPTHNNTKRDRAKYEVFGRWADLSDRTGGITICSDVKSGYDIHEGNMMLSLLKAPLQTDKWNDYGKRHFTYKVEFHSTPFNGFHATSLSDELNYPLLIHTIEFHKNQNNINAENIPNEGMFVYVQNDSQPNGIIIETLKLLNNNDIIARIYESNGGRERGSINFPFLNRENWRVYKTNLKESIIPENEVKTNTDQNWIQFEIELNSFEILTLILHKTL